MTTFIPGIELSRIFHESYIEPRLETAFPGLRYASALIGPGSEVLGCDTAMSTDHDWGPRVLLFLREGDIARRDAISEAIRVNAPAACQGYPVDINRTWITTVPEYIEGRLGIDIRRAPEPLDWLTFPSQVLAELTGGEVFRDDAGELTAARKLLHYYPHDVWLYLMASVWHRIGQEEHLMLRAGYAGDELGSAVIASRLVRDVMSLVFLMERRYAPYPKWFGTAFNRLNGAPALLPALLKAQTAADWKSREQALAEAYVAIAGMHNRLQITEPLPEETSSFFDRPFTVISGGRFAAALVKPIRDESLRRLSDIRLIGGIDQITDNTDFRGILEWTHSVQPDGKNVLRTLYDQLLQ